MSVYDTRTGKSSFLGYSFDIAGDDGGQTLFPDGTNYAAEDLNYADTTYVQILGRKSGEVSLAIVCSKATLDGLRGRRGQQGQLQTASGEARSAILLAVGSPRNHPVGGFVTAQVTWYV